MGNPNESRYWPDDVDVDRASEAQLQAYETTRQGLSQHVAPMLVSRNQPHTRLFVACLDGTRNDKDKDPQHMTNVGLFDEQIRRGKKSRTISPNVATSYVAGVGTQDEEWVQNLDGALGYSYGPRLEQMYLDFITQAYTWTKQDPQADISLAAVGFSRGAVMASLFTRMVDERGIQNPDGMKIDRDEQDTIVRLTPTRPNLVAPGQTRQALALFDPVATGVLNSMDVRPPPSVVVGFQITAMDESRDQFQLKQILDPGRSRDGRFYSVAVPGAHSDIGGSYLLDGLSTRNGNLMAAYLNGLSDQPFLPYRSIPTAPEMNVIHHSEQHQRFYTTLETSVTSRRGAIQNLSGQADTPNSHVWAKPHPNDAEPADAALMERTRFQHLIPPPNIEDSRLPNFFRQKPQSLPPPPVNDWNPLFRNMPRSSLDEPGRSVAQASSPAPGPQLSTDMRIPSHPGHWNYGKALEAVQRMEQENGIPGGAHSEQLAAALAVKAEREGISLANTCLQMGSEGQLNLLERGYYANEPEKRHTLDTQMAMQSSVEQHTAVWNQARSPHYAHQAPVAERTQEQSLALQQLAPTDRALFEHIRGQLPAAITNDQVALATLRAKQNDIHRPEQLDMLSLAGDRLFISGTTPGHHAVMNLAEAPPKLQDSVEQTHVFNQHMAQQQAIEAQQREQHNHGMRMG